MSGDRAPRAGSLSVFVLVFGLCLAVLALLAAATAEASWAVAERQAQTAEATYANEAAGQEGLAGLETVAAPLAALGAGEDEVLAALERWCAEQPEKNADGTAFSWARDGQALALSWSQPEGRRLDALVALDEGGRLAVRSWRATTVIPSQEPEHLWSGQ